MRNEPRRMALVMPPSLTAMCMRSQSVRRSRCTVGRSAKKQNPGIGPGFCSKLCARELLRSGFRTVDQLDVGHRRIVASAETALEDAQVAARTGLVTRAEGREQRADGFLVTQAREREAAIGNAVGLRQRDERLGDATQLLGLGQGGADEAVLDQRGGHVGEHGVAMGTGAAELTAGFLVAHGWDSW